MDYPFGLNGWWDGWLTDWPINVSLLRSEVLLGNALQPGSLSGLDTTPDNTPQDNKFENQGLNRDSTEEEHKTWLRTPPALLTSQEALNPKHPIVRTPYSPST